MSNEVKYIFFCISTTITIRWWIFFAFRFLRLFIFRTFCRFFGFGIRFYLFAFFFRFCLFVFLFFNGRRILLVTLCDLIRITCGIGISVSTGVSVDSGIITGIRISLNYRSSLAVYCESEAAGR